MRSYTQVSPLELVIESGSVLSLSVSAIELNVVGGVLSNDGPGNR